MNEEPLISVIIPTFNAANTIKRCVDSVLKQTYNKIEIICCDDCSTDNTVEILNEYSSPSFKVLVNEKNMRAAFSRNRCIEIAKGDYIAQIDDDDYCAPERIEKQLEFLIEHKEYDFVGSGIYYFDENGVWGKSLREVGYQPQKEDFLRNSVFANPTMMYRLAALKKVGGYRVAQETRRSQDYDLHMRLYAANLKGYIMSERLVFYYRGKNSYPKIKYKYRIDEAKLRYRNYKSLGLLPQGVLFALKPLIVGLVPARIADYLKKKNLKV